MSDRRTSDIITMDTDLETDCSLYQLLYTHTELKSDNLIANINSEQSNVTCGLLKIGSQSADLIDCCCRDCRKSDHAQGKDNLDNCNDVSKGKAPDGGYGWCVVFGCFLAHVVFAGLDRSEGIFFLLLTTRYGESAQLTSWPGAIVCTLQLVLGPVATILCDRFSTRVTVMFGGTLMFLGLFLSSFAPNFIFYLISHGLIGGLGRGITYVPGFIIVGKYFDRRSGLATGIATSGSGVGTFMLVPLMQYLAENYGFKGTFLILSGLACHIFVSAMLYRPLSMYYKPTVTINRFTEKCCVHRKSFFDKNEINLSGNSDIFSSTVEHELQRAAFSTTNNQTPIEYNISTRKAMSRQNKLATKKIHEHNCLISSMKICFPIENNNSSSGNSCRINLLKNPSFLMYCMSILLLAMAFRAAFTFIPALIESKGISKSEAALAVSVAGAVDTFGRIVIGFLLDLPNLKPFRLVIYNLVIFGISLIVFSLPSLRNFASFCVMSIVFGLLTGANISQKSVILADIFDYKDIASALGILMVFQGLGNLLGPPLSGAVKDVFASFDESFYLSGSLLVGAGILMTLCNIFNILHKRKQVNQSINQ